MTDGKFRTIRIDPRDFIGGPYEDCPKCRQHEFGVLHIHHNSCTRRCRACWHTLTLPLPELKKKVVYLDQFVFSNIMKMLSDDAPGHERAKKEKLWRDLFESLDVLCKMQLIVCPDSTEHHDESLISPFYKELKRTYEHFSTGISFTRPSSIQEMQIVQAFAAWLKNTKPEFTFATRQVTSGDLHDWQDRIFVTTDGILPGYKEAVQRGRRNVHSGLGKLFKQWQLEKKSFREVFEAEKAGYADSLLSGIEQDRQEATKLGALFTNLGHPVPRSVTQYSATMNTPLMLGLRHVAQTQFIQRTKAYPETIDERERLEDEARESVIEFIRSGAMNETPSNIIAASMYAVLASKAASGQKKPPDEGMATDINVVSALLPYCDAMFVDNICRSLLNDIPKSHALPYPCAVFSSKTSGEFLQYLSDIRKNAKQQHIELVQRVYGPKVTEPPKGIYGVGKRRSECGQ